MFPPILIYIYLLLDKEIVQAINDTCYFTFLKATIIFLGGTNIFSFLSNTNNSKLLNKLFFI